MIEESRGTGEPAVRQAGGGLLRYSTWKPTVSVDYSTDGGAALTAGVRDGLQARMFCVHPILLMEKRQCGIQARGLHLSQGQRGQEEDSRTGGRSIVHMDGNNDFSLEKGVRRK